MGLAQQQHGYPGLTDTAAHGQGQLTAQQHLVERQRPAVVASGDGQLPVQRFRADPDSHGGQLQRLTIHTVPHQQVAVQIPIIIVRCAAVMGFAGLQRPTNADQKRSGVLLDKGVLPLLGGQVGIQVLQFLSRQEGNIRIQLRQHRQLGKYRTQERLGVGQRLDDGVHRRLQIIRVPVLFPDDLLPVPLVHIGGVEIVQLLIPADGVHIGVQALPLVELVALQRQTLPLGQRVDHHSLTLDPANVEGDGALHAVQVIVDPGGLGHKQGGGYPVQAKGAGQLILKQTVQQTDRSLRLINGQKGGISLGNTSHMLHNDPLL